jgi:hypothetical protein
VRMLHVDAFQQVPPWQRPGAAPNLWGRPQCALGLRGRCMNSPEKIKCHKLIKTLLGEG